MLLHVSDTKVVCRGSRSLAVVGLLAMLLMVSDVQAQSIGEFLSDGSPDACVDPDPPDDASGEPNNGSDEGECYDWDYLWGLQCDNDFPPGAPPEDDEPGGEDPPGGETGDPGDTGGDDTGGDDPGGGGGVIVEQCSPDCDVIETPDGGVIIWFDEDEDDTGSGDTGDTGSAMSSPNVSDASAFAASVFDRLKVGDVFGVASTDTDNGGAASYIVQGRQFLQSATGEHRVRILLQRLSSTRPTANRYVFDIGQCGTRVRPIR